MRCAERTRLFDHLERTSRAFADAVSGLRDLCGYDLIAQERLVAHIRQACDAAQSSLAEHQEAHGCSRVAAGETAEHREPARR